MRELTKLFSMDFYQAIWRITVHRFCDDHWSHLWYILRENVEEDPGSYSLYLPFVYTYAKKFFASKDVKQLADSLGLKERISGFSLVYKKKTTLDEFSDIVIELGEISLIMVNEIDPEYHDYREAIYSIRWDSYRDGDFFGIVNTPKILDVNWMEGHADSYTKLPYQALVEYEGGKYEVCLAEDWPETIHIKTRCPFLKGHSEELINYRFHDLYDRVHDFYLNKFFRVSEEEKKSAMDADLPLIVGGKINHINVYDGNTGEKLVKIIFFIVNNCLRRVDLTMCSNMKDIHDYDDGEMVNYGWPHEEGLEQFKKNLLDLIHQYRDQLDDGFIVEREHMAEDKGCPKEYFYYLPLGLF